MPRKPMDYSKTIIYKLVCNDLNVKECYVGHTTDFKSRKHGHKQSVEDTNCKSYNQKKSIFIRDNGGFENWSMIEIEKFPCNDDREARARERHWYEELNAELNSNVPSRSPKEYYEENKEHFLEKRKEHYYKNREHKLEYQKQYLEQNKEQIKETKKKYYDNNKEHLLEQKKEYREQNKEKINLHKSTKIQCECGSITTNGHKTRHLKSLKHCQFIETNNI